MTTTSTRVAQAVDLALHLGQIEPRTTAIGLLTIITIVLMDRTRLGNFSMLIGMLVGSAAALRLGWTNVQTVGDVATIPGSLPLPHLPDLSLAPALVIDAIAIAIIVLIPWPTKLSRRLRRPRWMPLRPLPPSGETVIW